MRLLFALLYAALLAGANTALAETVLTEREDLRAGDMKKLVFHSAPKPVSEAVFVDARGAELSLADYRGKVVLLNFWATWCAPCRHEMPSLDALETELGGDDFAVVPVATGRNPVPIIERFYDKVGVSALPILRDPGKTLAADMGVMLLPVTVILDREGREIARYTGDADWNGAEARAVLEAVLAAEPGDKP